MYVHLYKPFYFPGEIVRGSVILDLHNQLPKDNRTIRLRFSGRETVGKYYNQVKESLLRQKTRNKSLKSSTRKHENVQLLTGQSQKQNKSQIGDIAKT